MKIFRSILILFIGMIILYFGVSLGIKLNIGVAPNDALFNILSYIFNIEVGNISIIGSIIYLLVAVIIFGKRFPKKELLQLIFIFSSGVLTNYFIYNLLKDFYIEQIYFKIILYVLTILLKVFGVYLIFKSNIMKTSLETMCEAISFKLNKSMPFIRQIIDIFYVLVIIILEIIIKDYSFIGIGTILDVILFSQLLKIINRIRFRKIIKRRMTK